MGVLPGAGGVGSFVIQLASQVLGLDGVEYVYNAYDTSVYFDQYAEIVKPFGKIVSIVETEKNVNLTALMVKRISFAWELMFTRPLHGIDLEYQGHVLNQG